MKKTSNTQKQPIYKRKWFIMIAVLVVIGAILGDKNKGKEEPTPTKAENKQEETKKEVKKDDFTITEDMTDEQKIEAILKSVAGKVYDSYEVSKADDGSIRQITLNCYYEIISTRKELSRGQNSYATKILKELQENNIQYTYYVQNVLTDFTDRYGNESRDEAMHIYLPKEEINKINFDNFNEDNLKDLADEYYIHPSLK